MKKLSWNSKSTTNSFKPGVNLSGLILCGLILCSIILCGMSAFLLCGCDSSSEEVDVKVIGDVPKIEITEGNEGSSVNDPSASDTGNGQGGLQGDSNADETVWMSEPTQLVWATYWDTDGLSQALEGKADSYDAIGYFAAYYDESGKAFIPEGTSALTEELKASGLFNEKKSFLTFVNDQTTSSGSKLKDTDLVYSLIGTPELASAHIDEIIALTKSNGYTGVEIDYEAIKNDMTLWNAFLDFIKNLNVRVQKEGLYLRVLFEPGAPIESFDWPVGPEYVMMCYNLYGYGPEQGPKADPAFLNKMVDKMEHLGGNINFALANGGYDWTEDEDVSQVQTAKIEEIIAKYGLTPTRDANSSDLIISYTDDDGLMHTIWYADEQTIEAWKQVIKSRGHEQFSIWRLP